MKTPEQLQQDQDTPDYIPFNSTKEDITNLCNSTFDRGEWNFEPEPRTYQQCGHGTPCFYARKKDDAMKDRPYAIMGFFSYLPDFTGKAIRVNYFYDF